MCLAIPARLVEYLDDDHHYGKVELGGVVRRVNTTMLTGDDTSQVGDYVLVHVGFAMARVSEEEAAFTLSILEQMGDVYENEIAEIRQSGALGEEDASTKAAGEIGDAILAMRETMSKETPAATEVAGAGA
ncbi:MAG: HypC/HybG/HupF family hydrogenase formation chaperone [Candidatus Dormibacteria bacterium]